MLRYAITDRGGHGGGSTDELLRDARRWAATGIDFIQIREKDLAAGELADLTRRVIEAAQAEDHPTHVLVNSRADVAAATGADGVHLTSRVGELTPDQVRQVFAAAGRGWPIISVSCHSLAQVRRAIVLGVEAILFGPVFGKTIDSVEVTAGLGMEALGEACRVAAGVKVFALGGVTMEQAAECFAMGAVGVAGIRLFQGGGADQSNY